MAQEEIIKLLSEMVEIRSISSDKNHRDDVDASAHFVQNLFADLGLNTQVIKVAGGMPAVVAHTEIDPSKKTVAPLCSPRCTTSWRCRFVEHRTI